MPDPAFYCGPTPAGESCQQVGPNYDPAATRAECRRYLDLLRDAFGPEPDGARLGIHRESHDFGSYLEVVVYVSDDAGEDAWAFGQACEDAPATWEALEALAAAKRSALLADSVPA